jgi:hypothetical protein
VVSGGRFSVYPSGNPVTLTRGGESRYPGVQLRAIDKGSVPQQVVHVTLPEGKGLQFVPEHGDRYQLTVWTPEGETKHDGNLLDRQTLEFTDVDLALSDKDSTSTIWVAVKATGNASLGDSRLEFRVGDQTSSSTVVRVVGQ